MLALRRSFWALFTALLCTELHAEPPAAEGPEADPAYVGFIWHYPFAAVGDDKISESGANVMMARCRFATVQPTETQFDFSSIEKQLQVAREEGVKLVLLLEFNPWCSPEWLTNECDAAGEATRGITGDTREFPQTGSPIYRRAQEHFVRELVRFLETADKDRIITHYIAGIEWWYPDTVRYAPQDIEAFRQWLATKYGDIAGLNAAWGAKYLDYPSIQPPRINYLENLYGNNRRGLSKISVDFPGQGETIPLPENMTAVSCDWAAYWNDVAARYINAVSAVVKAVDPTRPTVSFITFSWAQFAEWDYVDWSAVRLDNVLAASRDLDIIGMQLCFAGGDSYRLSAGLDMARKYGKPMWNMDLLDFVHGVQAGFADHEKNTHVAIQHGAGALFYCCWNGAKDFNFYPDWPIGDIRRMDEDAKTALGLVRGAKPAIEGAIVNPIVTGAPGDPLFGRNHVHSLMGWYKIIERLPASVDVLTLRELENGWAGLDRYRWVLVPDCDTLSASALKVLRDYSESGGLLISGGRFAAHDETGMPRTEPFKPVVSLYDFGEQYAGEANNREAHAGDTPPQMLWRPETDTTRAILETALDSLHAVFQSNRIAQPYSICTNSNDVRCARLIRNHRDLLYLVNHGATRAAGVKVVTHDQSKRPVEIHVDLDSRESNVMQMNGNVLALPPFRTSCIVIMESEPAN